MANSSTVVVGIVCDTELLQSNIKIQRTVAGLVCFSPNLLTAADLERSKDPADNSAFTNEISTNASVMALDRLPGPCHALLARGGMVIVPPESEQPMVDTTVA